MKAIEQQITFHMAQNYMMGKVISDDVWEKWKWLYAYINDEMQLTRQTTYHTRWFVRNPAIQSQS